MTEISDIGKTAEPQPAGEAEIDAIRIDPASLRRARAQYEAGEVIPGSAVLEWLASWGSEKELSPPKRIPATS